MVAKLDIQISDYTYQLPKERIAKYPLAIRDASKLLVYHNNQMFDNTFKSISKCIPKGSLIVSNNSKVIPARLFFKKDTGALIEVFCLEPFEPADYQGMFMQTTSCVWNCIVGNLKKWNASILKTTISIDNKETTLCAELIKSNQNDQLIRFSWNPEDKSFSDILDAFGKIPIPPYLERETENIDLQRYQTIYSKTRGSVAAPTAGLHFTPSIIENIHNSGSKCAEITLHVGAGTFKPIKSEYVTGHEMHREFFEVQKETIELLINHKGNIVSVGTTSLRTLESLYWIGIAMQNNDYSLHVQQWQAYKSHSNISLKESLNEILLYLENNNKTSLNASTSIFIIPGYQFKVVSQLITNFHQPQSSLILLVAAFIGDEWKEIYNHALNHDYRFLSYGDSSILSRKKV